MKNNDAIQKINERIVSEKSYLEHIQVVSLNFQSRVTNTMLLNLLINLIVLDQEKENDFLNWVNIAEKYFYELSPDKDLSEYEIVRLEQYKYLLSVIAQKPNMDLAKKYCNLHFDFIQKNYKLNKTESDLYEEVVMSLLEIKEFDKAYELSKKIQSVKVRPVLSTIIEYSFEKKSDNQESLIKKFKTILKRREGDPLVQKYLYFSYYYRGMLKIESTKKIFEGMVFGLD